MCVSAQDTAEKGIVVRLAYYAASVYITRKAALTNVPAAASEEPRLLDRVRTACRLRHLSYETEKAYAGWFYPDPKPAASEIKDHVAFGKGVEVVG